MTEKVVVYSSDGCGYSDMLLEDLRKDGVVFEEINVTLHPDKWKEVEALTGGERITPVMVKGEEVTVGFNGIGCVY